MVMVGHADATTKMLRAELVDARAKAKRNLGAAKKIKDKAKTRLVTPTLLDPRGALGQQSQGQQEAVVKLRELLAEGEQRLEDLQQTSAAKLREANVMPAFRLESRAHACCGLGFVWARAQPDVVVPRSSGRGSSGTAWRAVGMPISPG
eukprot:3593243-Rhodomonas_salina.2